MRPVQVQGHDELDEAARPPPHLLSAGRWSVKQSSVLLYHRRMGEPSHSWMGRLQEMQRGPETANLSRSIRDGIIQQGDSDAEFLGRFEANQTLAAFSPEELLDDQLARHKSPVPRFSRHHFVGDWQLRGDLYDDPLLLTPLRLFEDGSFEFAPDKAHRFAGRWGLYRDGAEERLQENRESAAQSKGPRSEGTHFWMWAQRGECKGFNMNADYRFLGRIKPSRVEDELKLSVCMHVCVFVFEFEFVSVHTRARACVCVCVRACVSSP